MPSPSLPQSHFIQLPPHTDKIPQANLRSKQHINHIRADPNQLHVQVRVMKILQNRSHLRIVRQTIYLSPFFTHLSTSRLVHCRDRVYRIQHRHSPQLRQLPILLHVLIQDLHVRTNSMEQLRDLLQAKQLASHIGIVHRCFYLSKHPIKSNGECP